jgi:O-antigen ligase
MENQVAWDVFMLNPILGAGLGYKYWEDVALFTPRGEPVSLRKIYIRGGTYIHNGWLWLLSKTGLLGMATFVVFIVMPFLRGLSRFGRLPEPYDQAVVFGFSFRGVEMLTEAVGNPIFFTVAMAAGFGVMAGVVLAVFKISNERACGATSIDHHSVLQRSAWHSLPLRGALAVAPEIH